MESERAANDSDMSSLQDDKVQAYCIRLQWSPTNSSGQHTPHEICPSAGAQPWHKPVMISCKARFVEALYWDEVIVSGQATQTCPAYRTRKQAHDIAFDYSPLR